jgi:GT2 family glycosyltransferase/glycosyltransferase involved in cell wall biosynthesis
MRYRIDRLRALLRDLFHDLPKRVGLTIQYHGWRVFLVRVATFPLRFTPLGPRMAAARATNWARAREWYRSMGRPVAVVIPTYGDTKVAEDCVASIKGSTRSERVRIILSDDGSAPEHVARLRAIEGVELVESERNTGFAANCNRGIERAGDLDVVLLNSDVIAQPGWLELLQHAAYRSDDVGIVGPKLLYEDGTIQSAGSHRNIGAPEWFDHRYRFKPSDFGPANVPVDCMAMTGAALYLKRTTLDAIGVFDEAYGMAYEDVDLCLRSWEAGLRVVYSPQATMTHLESKTRGMEQGEREIASQAYFWERWGDWFDARQVRDEDGRVRVIYVTEDTGVGGGHRVIYEHLNGLAERGFAPELWSLSVRNSSGPDWFDLKVPVRLFPDYEDLVEALEPIEAIKVATWWNTGQAVWTASVRRGIAVYFVQDIETSYYPAQPEPQNAVMASYRHEFQYLTTSQWVGDQLRGLHLDPNQVGCGVDLTTFTQLGDTERLDDVLLAIGRTNPLKNFPLTVDGWQAVPDERRPRLWLFGIEPQVADELEGARYFTRPSDAEVNGLYNQATALVQTSKHEGFCLPLLEAMAAGCAVICTDSHGNRDFCHDGENCLLVDDNPQAVATAITRLFGDADLRAKLVAGGLRTAAEYDYPKKLDEVARFFESVSAREAGAAPA